MIDQSTEIGDFRVTRTADGLRVDVLDYHADSLVLTHEVLERLGFLPVTDARPSERRPARRPPSRGDVAEP